MTKRPGGDLGSMTISKAKAVDTVPFAVHQPTSLLTPLGRPAKSLTVKLDGETYDQLRDYCHGKEKATGRRMTHQEVMVTAVKELFRLESDQR